MSEESGNNKASKVIEDNLKKVWNFIKQLEASHTDITTQFHTLKNQDSDDSEEWEVILNLFKKGCDVAATQLADIQKNFSDNLASLVSDKSLSSSSKSKDGSSKNDDANLKKNLKNREVSKDIEISNVTKGNSSNHVNNISGCKTIQDDFNKENCPIIQSGKNDELQKNCTSLNGDNVSAEKNCDENRSENVSKNATDSKHSGEEVDPNPSKIGIRLVAIEKLLDPNIAARSKELTITQKILNNNANSSIIILDSDDDDVITGPVITSGLPVNSVSVVTHITPSFNDQTGIKKKVSDRNVTRRKQAKGKSNKFKRVAVKIKRNRIIAQLIKYKKKEILISKSLAKKLDAIVLDKKLFKSLTTSEKASNRENVKTTTIDKGPEKIHSSNDDLEKRTNSNKSPEKVLLDNSAVRKNMEVDNSENDTSTTKEYTLGPRSRRKLKKKSKSAPSPSCSSSSSEDERAPKNKQEAEKHKSGSTSNINVEKQKHKKKYSRSSRSVDPSDKEEINTTKENKMQKPSEKSSKSSDVCEKQVNRCDSAAKKSSNLESKIHNKKNNDKEKDPSDSDYSTKNYEKMAVDTSASSDRDTEGNSPPKKIKKSNDIKSSSETKSKSLKSKSANISDIDSSDTDTISSKRNTKKRVDDKSSSQNKSDENKSLQESSKTAKSSDTDNDNDDMRSSKDKTRKKMGKENNSKSQSSSSKKSAKSEMETSNEIKKLKPHKSSSKSKNTKSSDADSSNDENKQSLSSKNKTDIKASSSENKTNESKSHSSKAESAKTSDSDFSDENMRSKSTTEKTKQDKLEECKSQSSPKKKPDFKASSSENKRKESKSQSAKDKSEQTTDTDSSDDGNMQPKSSKEKMTQDKLEENKSPKSPEADSSYGENKKSKEKTDVKASKESKHQSTKDKSAETSDTDSSDDENMQSKSSNEKTMKDNLKKSKSKSSKAKTGNTSDNDSSDTESIRPQSNIKKKTKEKSNSSKSNSKESKSQSYSNAKDTNTAVTESSQSIKSLSPAKETIKNAGDRPSTSKTKNPDNSDSDSSDSSESSSTKKTNKKNVESVSAAEKDDKLKAKLPSGSKSKRSDDSSDNESIKNSSLQEKPKRKLSEGSEDEDKESIKSLPDKDDSYQESAKSDSEEDKNKDSSDSEVITTKKRKRAKSQSRSSKSSDEDTKSEIADKKKRKRKRIRHDDSDSNNSDGNSPSTRKNIRKLIKKKDLDDDTKKAAREEEDRRKRIEERQKLYNSIYEKPQSTEIEELVLDFDTETKEKLLEVDKGLLKKLKPHQAKGVKFMWDACFETIKDAEEKPGSGCILGHCMGLGKTLQVITLTHTLLTNARKTGVERVLVITPLSTLTNWAREYKQWMKYCKKKNVEVYDMSRWRERNLRISKLNEWFEEGGVCIIGYDMFRILSNPKSAGVPKKKKALVQKALIDPGPDIVICDEGHLLKNEKTTISQAVNKLRTQRRIVLTGTPLQNNLKEYYCMIQFIKPNLLGTYKEYLNRFVNPITNGQYTDSTARDIQLMKNRAHILHKLLEGCIQRRDYSVLAPYLPPKHEYVVYISCSEMQKKLYEFYMTEQRNIISEASTGGKGAMLFQDLQNLRRIWTHPMSLRLNSDTVIKKRIAKDLSDSEGSLKDFIDDNDETSSSSSSSASSNSSDSEKSDAEKKEVPSKRGTRRTRGNMDPDESIEMPKIERTEDPSEWWMSHCPEPELNNINHSPKLVLLMNILERCEAIGDKVLVFSQSLQSLDVIEHFLSLIDKKTEGDEIEGDVGDFEGTWAPGIDYFRLDGSSSVDQREAMCNTFNDVDNLRARLFLISTRAGSLGINLVAANRVIIFDVSWNPSHDTQSIFRVYRFGQTKPCYIYRFIAMGTMEQKVYERQVAKQATAKRVLDEQQIGRHYNQNDLLELYKYELVPNEVRETPILPKDRLFAELLSKFEKLIFKYHEHDSLLENEESENLTEDERKAAWAEYEAEKERPAQQFVAYNRQNVGNGPVTSSKIFGLRTDVLLQLLNMKVSQDHPNLNDTERIRLVPSYLSRLYAEMNVGNTDFYRELIRLNAALQMPYMYNQGMPPMVGINPFAYANAGQMAPHREMQMNNPPTTDSQVYEID